MITILPNFYYYSCYKVYFVLFKLLDVFYQQSDLDICRICCTD